MGFIKIINGKKIVLIGIFMTLYIFINLFDGERGLISYFKKQNYIEQLQNEKKLIITQLNLFKKKNTLLTGVIDQDYLEILYRKKFMVGKPNEKIYVE